MTPSVHLFFPLLFQGHKKRELLGEIIPLMASNISLQRLFTEYKEQLDNLAT